MRRISEELTRKEMIDPQLGQAGKTRTTMGLIDVFMRSNQARRVFCRLQTFHGYNFLLIHG